MGEAQGAEGFAAKDAGFTNTLFHVTMTQEGTVMWSKSIYLATILFWVLGPPIMLVLGWRSTQEAETGEAEMGEPSLPLSESAPPELPAPSPDFGMPRERESEPAARRRTDSGAR